MPAVLTHDFFGRDAYEQVASLLGFTTEDERDAFQFGNQGPDTLFYLRTDPFVSKHNRVGELMHHAHPAHLLLAFHDALGMLPPSERAVGKAYLAGFCCHYLLDVTTHPFIFYMQYGICGAGIENLDERDADDVHAEIERDIDEMVLYTKTCSTIKEFRTYKELLHASDAVLAVVDKLYFYAILWTYATALDLNVFTRAAKSFRRTQWLFWSPSGFRHDFLGYIETHFMGKRNSFYRAMAHRVRAEAASAFANQEHLPWENPFTKEVSTESFWDLYEEAQDRVFDTMGAFFARDFDLAAAVRLTGGLNFEGRAVSEDEPFELPTD